MKTMAGRPTKRTPETEAKILNALRIGASRRDSCEANGVDYITFSHWLTQFKQFRQSVEQAESHCAVRMSARIFDEATKADGDPKYALEWLKRRRKEEWGDKSTTEHQGELTIKVRYEGNPAMATSTTPDAEPGSENQSAF